MKVYDYIQSAFRLEATREEANAKHEEHMQIIQTWDDDQADKLASVLEVVMVGVSVAGKDPVTYCFELGMMTGALLEQRKQQENKRLEMLMQGRAGE